MNKLTLQEAKPKMRDFLLMRLFCSSDREACERVGIHPTTVSVWRRRDDFVALEREVNARPMNFAIALVNENYLPFLLQKYCRTYH